MTSSCLQKHNIKMKLSEGGKNERCILKTWASVPNVTDTCRNRLQGEGRLRMQYIQLRHVQVLLLKAHSGRKKGRVRAGGQKWFGDKTKQDLIHSSISKTATYRNDRSEKEKQMQDSAVFQDFSFRKEQFRKTIGKPRDRIVIVVLRQKLNMTEKIKQGKILKYWFWAHFNNFGSYLNFLMVILSWMQQINDVPRIRFWTIFASSSFLYCNIPMYSFGTDEKGTSLAVKTSKHIDCQKKTSLAQETWNPWIKLLPIKDHGLLSFETRASTIG